ncbi:hypothetical protein [uncultured Streptomyces sp.]|uniref:hypothetical protein n=1 Tax=uncultured Streptomyces sp. TaxID=174707 RepID=UPI002626B007|nr:hypothetical protein [uncultured Streptomyces sp.]
MSHTSPITYARLGAVLAEASMVSREKAADVVGRYHAHADEELAPHGAAGALEEFGVAVSVHGDDVDSLREGYADLLARAAEVVGGGMTVTGVRLVEGEGPVADGRRDRVEFACDGRHVSVRAEHFADDYFDHMAAHAAVALTAQPPDPRSWRSVDFPRDRHHTYDTVLVLATAEQAAALSALPGLVVR